MDEEVKKLIVEACLSKMHCNVLSHQVVMSGQQWEQHRDAHMRESDAFIALGEYMEKEFNIDLEAIYNEHHDNEDPII